MSRAATGLPFDDIRNLLEGLPPEDAEAREAAAARTPAPAVPPGALGRVVCIVRRTVIEPGSGIERGQFAA